MQYLFVCFFRTLDKDPFEVEDEEYEAELEEESIRSSESDRTSLLRFFLS